MDQKEALQFISLQSRPENLGWAALAELIGEDFPIVYGWYRRGNVPLWRVPSIEKAAAHLKPPKPTPKRRRKVA